jgi:hypothetical protein
VAGEIEQILFLLARPRQSLEIRGIDDDVTGRAGHHPFARALERLTRRPGDVEQPLARRRLDLLVERPVRPEKPHQSHASSFSWATAAAAIRAQASASSASVV